MFGGDFNASCKYEPCTNVRKSLLLQTFIKEHSLIPINLSDKCKGCTYTFVPTKTSLDYIITDDIAEKHVQECEVMCDGAVDIVSDHLPILVSLSFGRMIHVPITNKVRMHKNAAWHKASADQITAYQRDMEEPLFSLLKTSIATTQDIDKLANMICEYMRKSAQKNIPVKTFNKHTKPYWTEHIKELHRNMRQSRYRWLEEGRPRDKNNDTYHIYKQSKRIFRAAQRKASDDYLAQAYRDLDEAAGLDIRLFWSMVRQQRKNPRYACQEIIIDDTVYSDEEGIANAFSLYYENLYKDKNSDEYDREFRTNSERQFETLFTDSFNDSKNTYMESQVEADEVAKAVKELKKRKAPGYDYVLNEHIIHGGPILLQIISKLFTYIIQFEYIPSEWHRGLIIPIYKGKNKKMSDPSSYRPVSLLSSMYKLFERVLNKRIHSYLSCIKDNFPNRQQHGFRPGHSCITAAFCLQESISHNLSLGSSVYTAFLDTKQAFDCVWHTGLFLKLYQLGITGKVWRLIVNSYENLSSAVVVNSVQSGWFPIQQGVRQGGVQSGFYYLVFIDELLDQLTKSRHGAKIFDIDC